LFFNCASQVTSCLEALLMSHRDLKCGYSPIACFSTAPPRLLHTWRHFFGIARFVAPLKECTSHVPLGLEVRVTIQ